MESIIAWPSPRRLDRPLTVLHVRTVVGAGGADKTTLKSPYYLRGSGYRAAAAYLRADANTGFAEIRKRARQWRCPLIEISDRGAFDLSVVAKLYAVCRRLNVRIWHAHEYKSNVIGLIVGRLLGLKLVTTVHGWVERSPKLNFFYRLDLWALRRFDRVVVVSQDLYDDCLTRGVDGSRLRLIENAIETERYRRRYPSHEARQQFAPTRLAGRARERLVIGTIGRLSPEKGFDLLIEAFANLNVPEVALELWIAGEGDQRSQLEDQVTRLGLSERVILLGYVSDPEILYQCFDIFCLPSLREGLPNTLLEALAMAVPVVATKVGGIPAVLQDGIEGWLVDPGSAEALRAALAALIQDADLRADMARDGRRLVEREFDFRVRMNKMIAVYDELLADEAPKVTRTWRASP